MPQKRPKEIAKRPKKKKKKSKGRQERKVMAFVEQLLGTRKFMCFVAFNWHNYLARWLDYHHFP